MSDISNVYAVTRIRVKENGLLTENFMNQLVQAGSYQECLRMLRDKGWVQGGSDDLTKILSDERAKTWDLMREILKKDISRLDVFLYANDYLNLKSAIKETSMQHEYKGIYVDEGAVPAALIRKAVSEKDFKLLPERLSAVAEEALRTYLMTNDGQLCDILVDKAALEAIYQAGRESGSVFLKEYAETTVASADIKIALRAAKTGKRKDFYEKALAACDSLDITDLSAAAMSGMEKLTEYIGKTIYAGGVEAFKVSMSQFEKWCDDLLIEKMRPQKYNPFGIDPIAAFVLARENEIKSVRIVLSGKLNQLPDRFIEERIREMYA